MTSVRPGQTSVDTGKSTAISYLDPDQHYVLQKWTAQGWKPVTSFRARHLAPRFAGLSGNGLYWMVADGSRRLERVFTIEDEKQRWW